jgi:hypothetical protein
MSVSCRHQAETSGGVLVFAQYAPLLILIVFALAGVIVGFAQQNTERWCPYCKLQVTWKASTCPHCRCRLDDV